MFRQLSANRSARQPAALGWTAWTASFLVVALLSVTVLVGSTALGMASPLVANLASGATALSVFGFIVSAVGVRVAKPSNAARAGQSRRDWMRSSGDKNGSLERQ